MKTSHLFAVSTVFLLAACASSDTKITGTLGWYVYNCDDGTQFTMTPADDMSAVRLESESSKLPKSIVLASAPAGETDSGQAGGGGPGGQRFQAGNIIFVGAGEEVTITLPETVLHCEPMPSAEAPFNFGDAGEGGGVKPDVALVVSESIVGKWQSLDDPLFVREFKDGNIATDWHDGVEVSSGSFTVFDKARAPELSFPLEENAVYIQMKMSGTQDDTLTFKLAKMTPEELELIYMERGGTLRFTNMVK